MSTPMSMAVAVMKTMMMTTIAVAMAMTSPRSRKVLQEGASPPLPPTPTPHPAPRDPEDNNQAQHISLRQPKKRRSIPQGALPKGNREPPTDLHYTSDPSPNHTGGGNAASKYNNRRCRRR
eukprot:5502672-Pyramimonas_sp.AAC.1